LILYGKRFLDLKIIDFTVFYDKGQTQELQTRKYQNYFFIKIKT